MSGPLEEFLDADGNAGADRVPVAVFDLAAAWKRATTRIPVQFAIGTAKHESRYTLNERDTETSGKQTGGLFQLTLGGTTTDRVGDATLNGFPELEPLMVGTTPEAVDAQCKVFATKCERQLDKILDRVDTYNSANGLPALDRANLPPDVWAYLAIAHNQGLGPGDTGTKGALGTIDHHGLDWDDYKRRNAGKPWGNVATDRGDGIYGDDVISGGPDFSAELAAPLDAADAPLLTARNEMRLRVGLVVVLVLLIVYAVLQRAPLKASV